MTFKNDKNVGCPKVIYDCDRMRGGKIEKFLEKKIRMMKNISLEQHYQKKSMIK